MAFALILKPSLRRLPSSDELGQSAFEQSRIEADRAAYDSHGEADYVRSFRSALYPYLGSPWDERVGDDITR